jgi:TatD DNase family protein
MRFVSESLRGTFLRKLVQVSTSRQFTKKAAIAFNMPVTVTSELQKTEPNGHTQNNRPSPQTARPPKVRPAKAVPGQPSKADRQIPVSPILSEDGSVVPLIDIGANLTGRKFSKHAIPSILQRASQAGITHIIITGTSYAGSKSALELCQEFDGTENVSLRCTVGIHPHDATRTLKGPHAKTFEKGLEGLVMSELGLKYCVAMGECGLDYDRKFSTHEDQKVVFEKQLCLAQKLGKPVFLHSREAHGDFLGTLKPFLSTVKAVAHCHTDPSVENLKELWDAGMYIGLTGMICDEREGRFNTDILQHIPLDKLMVETDSPYLFPRNVPRPWGKWENEPCLTSFVVRKIVEVCPQYTEEEVARKTTAVAKEFFGL